MEKPDSIFTCDDTPKHDYAAVLRDIKDFGEPTTRQGWSDVIHALRFAEKMMQEPSRSMRVSFLSKLDCTKLSAEDRAKNVNACFKSMRDAALKELGE